MIKNFSCYLIRVYLPNFEKCFKFPDFQFVSRQHLNIDIYILEWLAWIFSSDQTLCIGSGSIGYTPGAFHHLFSQVIC